jgi:heme/copper-type cytochrome/quinol oxidase subunit 2
VIGKAWIQKTLIHKTWFYKARTRTSPALWQRWGWLAGMCVILAAPPAGAQAHVIEVLADKDSRYKVAGERSPEITVKAGEPILLRVTARRGKSWNRDGSIHGFTLLHAKDRSKVSGWELSLKPGDQEFHLTAPTETGEYVVVCTVICSEDHEGMHMKFVVVP